MKGILPITIAILGVMATSTIFISLTLPILVLKYHLNINLKQEYEYQDSQLILLTLVSSKYNESYSMYQVFSERDSNGFNDDMKDKVYHVIETLSMSRCFKIVTEKEVILNSNCNPKKNVGEIYIFKPYNERELVEELILVYE
ncbi:MAG: hypothetical protein QXG39_00915 [Candidatus Aenigmatarchaeota archaeon]